MMTSYCILIVLSFKVRNIDNHIFSKKRSVTRRRYCDPIGRVDKGTKKSQIEYIMGHKRAASQLTFLKITESQ